MSGGRPVSTRTCVVEGCARKHQGHGFCRVHYKRWYRYGDPTEIRRASSVKGMSAAYKAEWVAIFKMLVGCADCGYAGHPAALDFDHRPGTTKVRDIKSGRQLGWAALRAEIAKCDVVCANCHRIRTFVRRGGDG